MLPKILRRKGNETMNNEIWLVNRIQHEKHFS